METRSLDDVILKMWQQFGQAELALPRNSYRVIESVAGINLDDFFKRYVDGIAFQSVPGTFGTWLTI